MASHKVTGESSIWVYNGILWRIKIPNRVKLVTWRLLHNSLPVLTNLGKGCMTETSCLFCGYKDECSDHLFRECWWTKYLWQSTGLEMGYDQHEKTMSLMNGFGTFCRQRITKLWEHYVRGYGSFEKIGIWCVMERNHGPLNNVV